MAKTKKQLVENEVKQQEEVKETDVVATENVRPKKKQIALNEMVEVRNITNGILVYVSKKTGAEWVWEGFGATEWMEVGELVSMKSSANKILTEPWLIIEDMDVVEYLGLKHIYDKIIDVERLDKFFAKSPEEIEKILKIAPNGIKTLVASKAKEMVEKGELDSKKRIEVIERILNVRLDE